MILSQGRASAARLAHNQEAGGSIPPPATSFGSPDHGAARAVYTKRDELHGQKSGMFMGGATPAQKRPPWLCG